MKKIFRALLKLRTIFLNLKSKLIVSFLKSNKNIEIGKKLELKGTPLIDIKDDCFLLIEDSVTLNSQNRGYHVNMHSPIKLYADRKGAIIRIGANTRIHGTCIHAYESITIGKNCLIAANCQIFDGSGHDLSFSDVENRINTRGVSKPVLIEDNVWIGINSIILPGVTIGNGSVIAANSVVTKDIPPMVLAGGNPAKIIKRYE
ncbi:acyltransferase [Vibrio parahaemolyticus]|nr:MULTISPECIES: acyltransferase [Vibrio]EGQ8115077.1 acyltransferase [Vibrio parahaemolyticus]MDW1779862.1 acyltransferase [Vibrio sp. Vb2134]MDW2084230.1 acyltransferase [Vibrio sp. 2134-1]OKQ15681.1 acetyltransferase [Vibrio antiquarius]QKS94388.1 acyltransferase [Vibrio alginolyticus]